MQILQTIGMACFCVCLGFGSVQAQAVPVRHAISMHGEPKYAAEFKAFDYVNPDAPKRGVLKQGMIGTFDSFNPFIMNGLAPGGIGLTHDTLLKASEDEPFSLYGLVAGGIEIPADRSWVAFHIRPEAKFNDGTPITADDVIFSFETLRDKGLPTYRYYYNDVQKVTKTSDRRVVFMFKKGSVNRELPLILGDLPVLSQAYWTGKDFAKTTLVPPVSSGSYRIKSFEPGRKITYERNPTYWAQDLNVNRGFYNFDLIEFDYYRDATVMTEAFKAGAIDVRMENEAKKWAAFASEPSVVSGQLKRMEFHHELPSGMQGFVYNLRRPLFADRRVREALGYAFDFNWANSNLFHGLYKRTTSYFDNSSLKAPPLPSEAELKLLEPYRTEIPQAVFTTEYTPPDNSGNMRANLTKALVLLAEAGWTVQEGALKDKQGNPFEFEILLDSASSPMWERVVLPFVGQLKRLGIKANIRVVDIIQYKNRLDSFDYDMIVGIWGQSLSPGNEQRYFWGSQSADSEGSSNYAGLKSKAIDGLIEQVISARTRPQLQTAVQALDRVLLWSFIVIPHWHTPVHRYLYWNKFGIPKGGAVPMKGVNILTWWAQPH